MDLSDSFHVIERMIRQAAIEEDELRALLATLESQGMITADECQALLDLARELKSANSTAS